MNSQKINELLVKIRKKRLKILVLGDVMLDKYVSGNVKRISPEAPVPVLNFNKEKNILGGAGNVVNNLVNIGVKSSLLSLVGYDDDGEMIKKMLNRLELYEDLLIQTKNIQTTRKTRFISNGSHLLRLDIDSSGFKDLDYEILRDRSFESISKYNVIIISDYNKGVCFPHLMQDLIIRANSQNIPIFIDPKGEKWDKYLNATCLTPNTKETEAYLNRALKNDSDFEKAAREIKNSLNLKSFLITRGSDGMTCYDGNNIIHQRVGQKEVFDVSGAGDTVIASLAASFCSGFQLSDCLELSSILSSEVIAYSGTTPFDTSMLEKING
jgi:D-beta-D-heptose 7-phosphate kinase / D-beta-D-heptose 1-phosphate adenosyltransferase